MEFLKKRRGKKKKIYFWFLTIISSLGSYFAEGGAGWRGSPCPVDESPVAAQSLLLSVKSRGFGIELYPPSNNEATGGMGSQSALSSSVQSVPWHLKSAPLPSRRAARHRCSAQSCLCAGCGAAHVDASGWSTCSKAARDSASPFPSPWGLAGPLPSALRPASRHGPAPGLSPAPPASPRLHFAGCCVGGAGAGMLAMAPSCFFSPDLMGWAWKNALCPHCRNAASPGTAGISPGPAAPEPSPLDSAAAMQNTARQQLA